MENEDLLKILKNMKRHLAIAWIRKYNLAKAYYEHYGNLDIPSKFKTTNGYDRDEDGIALGYWIDNQRRAYKGNDAHKINEDQIKLLEDIDMKFENHIDLAWKNNYNLAKAYYEHYGNSDIPQNFKTTNGYDRDDCGIALGIWLSKQKQAYKGQTRGNMDEKRIKLLEEIGICWYLNKKADDKAQKEIITENNERSKKIEILNRVRSYLITNYCDDSLPSKEEINDGFLDELNHVTKKKLLH